LTQRAAKSNRLSENTFGSDKTLGLLRDRSPASAFGGLGSIPQAGVNYGYDVR
jgi:hypothetical protein